jgi:2-iminobutanoate/2-iminopropanoate deaminase
MNEANTHSPIVSDNLPQPVGPYSPGVSFERLIFVSGQGATDPATGELVGSDVATQTEQVFKNIAAILEAGGSSLQHILRCGVFLVDMRDFGAMNAVYERMMQGNKAARTTVQVTALPINGLRVEIDAIAYRP